MAATTGTIHHVRSADGARIGWETVGEGPPLLVVHGGTADRSRWAPVRDALAARLTLHLVDRRGRGLSTDEPPDYALAREAEDLLAVAAAVGEAPAVLAHSYGATCALEALPAATFGPTLLYEPAFGAGGGPVLPPAILARIEALVAAGDPEAALELFFTDVIMVPPEGLAAARALPDWPARVEVLARTFAREGHAVGRWRLRPERYASLRTPVRFLLGTATAPALAAATRAAHDAIPGSDLVELAGQGHVAMQTDPEGFCAAVTAFVER